MKNNKILYFGLILSLLCGCGSVNEINSEGNELIGTDTLDDIQNHSDLVQVITGNKSVSDEMKTEAIENKIVIDESEQKNEMNETVDILEDNQISHINIKEDIINADEVKRQGGNIEFADYMTYKEFLDLNWVNDVDERLDNDTKVYIVKIYYPNGYEHYKIGLINKCEAIGIYRVEDGEYLGGSYKERAK